MKLGDHAYIALTVLFTVYSQLVMRWQVGNAGAPPAELWEKGRFVFGLLLNPWVLSGVVATLLAGISWMLAMTRFEVSYAFPFMSLNFLLVLAGSALLFGESVTATKLVGTALVVAGVVVIARG